MCTTASLQHAQIESAEDSWPITIPMNNHPSQVCRERICALTTFDSSKGAKRIALRGHCLLIDHNFPTRTSDTADVSLPISKLDCEVHTHTRTHAHAHSHTPLHTHALAQMAHCAWQTHKCQKVDAHKYQQVGQIRKTVLRAQKRQAYFLVGIFKSQGTSKFAMYMDCRADV